MHLDVNDYYGGDWAAFNFEGLQRWIKSNQSPSTNTDRPEEVTTTVLKEGETLERVNKSSSISHVQDEWLIPEKAEETQDHSSDQKEEQELQTEAWTKDKVLKSSAKFNLDLTPKLLFSRGSMVELLISSNVSRYTEFKGVSRVLTVINGALEHVPSSRADVFTTKHVSVVEKRILMKFLTFCLDFERQEATWTPFKGKLYKDFLKHQKLTDNLIHFVQHSIAMVDQSATCEEGLRSTHKFLSSLGRFGNTPFLWSMYGSGELPQAFCRLCAVFGGTYYLGKTIDGVIVEGSKVKGISTNGVRIECDKLVMPGLLCPKKLQSPESSPSSPIRRSITLLSDSILPHEREQLTFLSVPPEESKSNAFVYVTEVGAGAAACPKDMYVLYASTVDPEAEEALAQLYDQSKRLWTLKFDQDTTCVQVDDSSENLFLSNDPAFELDYDKTIDHAKAIFNLMYPGEDFLPRAPEPDEIIIGDGDDENQASNEGNVNPDQAEAP